MFLLNSCLDLFSAPRKSEDPLFRRYGVNLPSSLTVNLPSALVYSTRPRVSVCGTGAAWVKLSGFSREYDYPHYWILPKKTPYYQVQLGRWICLPSSTPLRFNPLFRQEAAVSLLRRRVTHQDSNGILTVSSIALAIRLMLRTRLTLNRLALFRKPWSYSGRESNPPYRYLFLHLLYSPLQDNLRTPFNAVSMLPYRYFLKCYPAPSVSALYPIIIHARTLD